MTVSCKEIAWRQFGATMDMLERAMLDCPEELWSRSAPQMGFWFLAYHTLFYLDYDFSRSAEPFRSPEFDIHEYELRELPLPYEHPYSRTDVSGYLRQCRTKCRRTIATLDEDNRTLRGCERIDAGLLELVLYHLRHVQHHAAQLNLLLRQETDSAPLWIRRTTDRLE